MPRYVFLASALLLFTPSASGWRSVCSGEDHPRRFTTPEWSQVPQCEDGIPDHDPILGYGNALPFTTFQIVNLSESRYRNKFCCMANYTAIVPANKTVEEYDDEARGYYDAAVRVLERFDCGSFYPYNNCTPCAQAYRTWICAVTFPRLCKSNISNIYARPERQRICKDVCFEVVRRCPVDQGSR
eukprot:Hpha_TRINITY_DN11003_c0_g1::TRINITY_DN11003_c0_g1_i2::g.92763::m.92763